MRYPESSFDGDMADLVAHSVFRNGNPREDQDDEATSNVLWGRFTIPQPEGDWPDWFEWETISGLPETDLDAMVVWVMGLGIDDRSEGDVSIEVIY